MLFSSSLQELPAPERRRRKRLASSGLSLLGCLLLPSLAAAQADTPAASSFNWLLLVLLLAGAFLCWRERQRRFDLEDQLSSCQADQRTLQDQRQLETEKLACLLEALPNPVYSKDPAGNYLSCNQAFCDYLQHPKENIIGRNCFDLLPRELAEVHSQADHQLAAGAPQICYQGWLPHGTKKREILFNKAASFDAENNLEEIWGMMTDITDLISSQLFLSNILNAISYPVFVKDDQSRYCLVNQALNAFVGYSETEMLGKTDSALYRKREAERFQTTDLLALQETSSISYESTITSKQGKSSRIDVRKKAFQDRVGNSYLVGVYHDVTELYRVQEKNASLQSLLYNIIDSMPSLIIAIDMLEQVTQWNHRAADFSGVAKEDAIGRQLAEVFPHHADLEPLISRALETAQDQLQHKICWQIGDRRHYLDVIVYPLSGGGLDGLVIRADNIDERVRMEEMMIFTEKMVSIGSLAAGMAHEINNPLAIIIQNAQVLRNRLQEKLPKNEQVANACGIQFERLQDYLAQRNIADTLETILQSGARATRIVEDMVNFSQRRVSCFSPCQIGSLIEQTLELARSDYDLKKKYAFREIEVERDIPQELPTIHCETDQIQQVLLNLLRNGAQSMAEHPQPQRTPKFTIRVRAEQVLRIEVIDNGPGIEEKLQKQIFDPFFSTRPVGTGTGLGLAAAYFIMTEKHGGNIWVESKPGQGCRFVLELPISGLQHDS